MKSPSTVHNRARGFTLIEMILYIALMSGLTSVFIPYAYAIHEQDILLLYEIQNAQP